MTIKEFKAELLENRVLNGNLDLDYLFKYSVSETVEELTDEVLELINEREIIYYSNAIEYLSENDPSLQESLEIASEYGFEVENINSELLATLLLQRELTEALYNIG